MGGTGRKCYDLCGKWGFDEAQEAIAVDGNRE